MSWGVHFHGLDWSFTTMAPVFYFFSRPSCLKNQSPFPKSIVPSVERRCLRRTQPFCKISVGHLQKKSDALYAKFFGSVKEEITSTFKEFKKLIAEVTNTAASIGHPSPIALPRSVASGSQDSVEGRAGSLAKSEVGNASSESEQEESRGEEKRGHTFKLSLDDG